MKFHPQAAIPELEIASPVRSVVAGDMVAPIQGELVWSSSFVAVPAASADLRDHRSTHRSLMKHLKLEVLEDIILLYILDLATDFWSCYTIVEASQDCLQSVRLRVCISTVFLSSS